MRSKPQLILAASILMTAAVFVYGLTVASAQNDGPPGPGWREIKPPKSLWRKWMDGEDTRRRLPPPARPTKPRQ